MNKPSVTQLIDLLNKPALIDWANRQGLEGVNIKEARKGKMQRGSNLHKQIENFILYGECMNVESHQKGLINFLKDKEILDVEKKIETEWFTGILDCSLIYKGKKYIIDYKSKAKRVYFDNKLQLIAYSMAYDCDYFAIVSIPNFQFFEVEIKERKKYEDILKSLSNIYMLKKELNES
jgi:hypothetical protein